MIKALSGFTPILVDGDTEKEIKAKYRVNGYPNTIFADAKGEAVGAPIVGAVPVDSFLKSAQDYAKKIKPGKPSKDFATLTGAKTELDAAKESAKTDKDAALKELKKLIHDYKGTDVGTEAAKLVKELEPPPDAGK